MESGASPRKHQIVRYTILCLGGIILAFVLSGFLLNSSGFLADQALRLVPRPGDNTFLARVPADSLKRHKTRLERENGLLLKKLDSFIPRQPYLIINTTHNRFRLMKYNSILREGDCSTGSFTILTTGKNQKWIFETPRGMLKVRNKQEDPVWVKPDWAFIEEGLPVPPARHSSRYDYGTLGDYKLELGNGYMIHGTLYKRFLGMAVTHGCVRLGDDDLKAVYQCLRGGSRVYIY
jgi:hypothetical protein